MSIVDFDILMSQLRFSISLETIKSLEDVGWDIDINIFLFCFLFLFMVQALNIFFPVRQRSHGKNYSLLPLNI